MCALDPRYVASEPTKNQPYYCGPIAYSQPWYDLRVYDEERTPPVVFGASDAGAVCHVDRYRTPLDVYLEVRGLKEPFEGNEFTKWGSKLEPLILEEYCDHTGNSVSCLSRMYMHSQHIHIGATPDGLVLGHNDAVDIVVEAKSTSSYMYDEHLWRENDCYGPQLDSVPRSVYMQVQQQMLVTGASVAHVAVLIDKHRFKVYQIQYDHLCCQSLIDTWEQFLRYVKGAEPPEADPTHPGTKDALDKVFGVDPDKTIELDEMEAAAVHDYEQAQEAIKEAEARKLEAQNKIRAAMQDAAVAYAPSVGKLIRRTQVAGTKWTEKDVQEAKSKIGKTKRRPYVRLSVGQVK